jgi:chemosensory pili system protein ChpC
MADHSNVLPCVLIPVADRQLLLPNVSIAEVVDYAQPEPAKDSPDWLVGYLSWRGLQLPVISYDAANGGDPVTPANMRGRIAVLNTIGDDHNAMPFVAMMTQGIPSQTKLAPDQIVQVEGTLGPADLMAVEVEGHTACIPNLDYLESLAAKSLAA